MCAWRGTQAGGPVRAMHQEGKQQVVRPVAQLQMSLAGWLHTNSRNWRQPKDCCNRTIGTPIPPSCTVTGRAKSFVHCLGCCGGLVIITDVTTKQRSTCFEPMLYGHGCLKCLCKTCHLNARAHTCRHLSQLLHTGLCTPGKAKHI